MVGVPVTDHALVRYLERVLGFDIEALKQEMITARTESLIRTLGDGWYPADGHWLRVQEGKVVTVVTSRKRGKRA